MVNIISHSCPRCNSYSLYKYGKDKFLNTKLKEAKKLSKTHPEYNPYIGMYSMLPDISKANAEVKQQYRLREYSDPTVALSSLLCVVISSGSLSFIFNMYVFLVMPLLFSAQRVKLSIPLSDGTPEIS